MNFKVYPRFLTTVLEILMVIFMGLFIAGIYYSYSYSIPAIRGLYLTTARSSLADKSVAYFNSALISYQERRYESALSMFNQALENVYDSQGKLKANKREMASQIKFLSGNALLRLNRYEQAVEAYKETLRINPQHLYAKYNLELLLSTPALYQKEMPGNHNPPPKKSI